MSIYELHLGSWRRHPDGGWLSYRDAASRCCRPRARPRLHPRRAAAGDGVPFYGSWGYQTTVLAPTSRFGTPQDLMFLIDHLHQRGVGVILDWVLSHFPEPTSTGSRGRSDASVRARGSAAGLHHPDWHTLIFNYGRDEVRSFLLSSADHWLRHTTPTGCARSTPWPRCSISTTRGRRASGSERPRRPGEPRGRLVPAPPERGRLRDASRRANLRGGIDRVADGLAPHGCRGLGSGSSGTWGGCTTPCSTCDATSIHRRFTTTRSRSDRCTRLGEPVPLSHDEVVHGSRLAAREDAGDDWQRFA